MNNSEREKILIRASWGSIVGNAALSLMKVIVGLYAGSMAVLSDGIDSATDVVISFITLFTARIVNKPPNRKYAFGYEKAEDIATKILSFVIFFAGIQMLLATVKGIFFSETREMPALVAIYVTVVSIVGKLLLALYQYRQGKRANSAMLTANAKNMRNDVLISGGVLLGLLFTFVLKLPVLDAITGLLISVFIIRTAVLIFIDANVALMDGVKDISVYQKIFEAVAQVRGASHPHRVRSRQIGNLYMIVLDVEVDGNITLNEAHDIAHAVEASIYKAVENVYDIVVHIEPKGEQHESEKFGWNEDMIK
ncbi:cation transporter [Bacteroidia bacterium]|nr:cation transporter [Bacteroidia bacterium]